MYLISCVTLIYDKTERDTFIDFDELRYEAGKRAIVSSTSSVCMVFHEKLK